MDTLTREANRLHHLIDDLLTISRLDREQIDFQKENFNFNQFLKDLVSDRSEIAQGAGVDLLVDFPPFLPCIWADITLIEQVAANLLTNAINYTSAGGSVLVSTFEQQRDGENWVGFSVKDTGYGMEPDERIQIFERFFRGDASRKTKSPGTGLGLSICQEIVQRHGGKIDVESTPGEGSTFTVWLKVALP